MLNEILMIMKNELEIELTNVTEETALVAVGIDSITFMTLIIYIEEKYDIQFSFDGIFMQEYSTLTFKLLIKEINDLISRKD